ncbi:hypothetical protein HAX54_012169 [Datura stramonium]|uniref:Uncharacterized protein n=1 Tax=Datura stramonium TaxID=4076 RepID=A0ABS8TKW4_DATST|nr:hypothetical protein [Datura stramonium]
MVETMRGMKEAEMEDGRDKAAAAWFRGERRNGGCCDGEEEGERVQRLFSGHGSRKKCKGIHGQDLRIGIGLDMVPSSGQLESKEALDTVPSSGQLESEEAHDRRRTADRPNHETFLDTGINSERP